MIIVFMRNITEKILGICDWHWFEEKVSLRINTVHGMKHLNLLRSFHTFCNNRKLQFVCHVNNRINDLNTFLAVFWIHFNKFHIKFQNIDIGILEHIKRRVTTSKIIHKNTETILMKLINRFSYNDIIFGKCSLSNLHKEHFGCQSIFYDKILKKFRNIDRFNVSYRDIDGDRNNIKMIFFPIGQSLADCIPDISIQCSDHTVILEKWNKFSWRNKTTGRTDPAGESFHTDDCTSDTVAFGLQIESKFFVFQTDFYVVEHLLFFFQLINDLICEITDPFIKISLDLGSSELCIVTHGRCIRMLLCNGVDTDDWKKPLVLTVDANITANCFVNQIDQLLVIRNIHKEMISTEIASQISFHLLYTKQVLTDILKQNIPCFLSVPVIK